MVFNSCMLGLRWQQETEGELLSVTVNPHGYVTATYNKSGAKAAVTVWDSSGTAVAGTIDCTWQGFVKEVS